MTKIQSGNKRVESSLIACLDPGSIPGDSTKTPVNTGVYNEKKKKVNKKRTEL